MKLRKLLLPFVLLVSLSGCVTLPTGPSVTMAPASWKPLDIFQSESEECKKFADRRMGKYYDYVSSQDAQFYYNNAYVKCMISYGSESPPAKPEALK